MGVVPYFLKGSNDLIFRVKHDESHRMLLVNVIPNTKEIRPLEKAGTIRAKTAS